MALFWEFFTFELKFRFKSLSTYVYFLVWVTFSFLCVAAESFGLIGNDNGKILLNSPFANTYNDLLRRVLRHHHHGGHFRHVHPARFPARYLPDPVHEADF